MRKIALQEEKRTESSRDWILRVYWELQLTQQAGCSTDRRTDGRERSRIRTNTWQRKKIRTMGDCP